MEMRKDTFIQTEMLIDTNGCVWYKRLKHNFENFGSMCYDRAYFLFNITKYIDKANGGILLDMEQLPCKTIVVKGTESETIKGYAPYTKLKAQSQQVLVLTEVKNSGNRKPIY